MKHYSSGMRVRLAFSVAAHLEPEILFIDEVLSVGDAEFQAKCLGKMEEVAGGRTHRSCSSVTTWARSRACARDAIWLDHGKVRMDGDPQEVVEAYLSRGGVSSGRWVHPPDATCGSEVRIESIEVLGVGERPEPGVPFDEPVRICIEHRVTQPVRGMWIRAHIHDMSGTLVLTTSNTDDDKSTTQWEPGTYRQTFEIPGALIRPGRYLVSARAKFKNTMLDEHENVLDFDVLPIGFSRGRRGVITPVLPWKLEQTGELHG